MIEYWKDEACVIEKQTTVPAAVKDFDKVEYIEQLLDKKTACVSFSNENVAKFIEKGAYVVLDYGKELCGSVRIVTRVAFGPTKFRITFGESLTECYSSLGEKNATNDHSPRDFVAEISNMSDLTFGATGFRFVRIELLTEAAVWIKNIFAVNTLPVFEREGYIKTSAPELNQIIDTAAYTLKLNFQNGYIWDGIKRDRLVWCGDLHQEIVNSIYLYGDNKNITNSLSFLRDETPADMWMNNIPSYSAWWVINLCDYCKLTGNKAYFEENKDYAKAVMRHFEKCVYEDGTLIFDHTTERFCYFLDWPTRGTEDAAIGTAAIITLAANKFLELEEEQACRELVKRLEGYLDQACKSKQARAFQILAGRNAKGEAGFLEQDGAAGFSTFMAYYILKADAMAGGNNMLAIIKEYFGAMLSRGATTFWEDFDMEWLKGSGRIDEFPKKGQKDIHGDYGAYCYEGFRNSLCHGWASGVLSFIVEHMLGLNLINGGESHKITPNMMDVKEIEAKIPIKEGWLFIKLVDDKVIENKRI